MDFDDPRFKHESYRLHTFQDFPRSNIVSPVELARDGFLYMGVGDRVGCVYCLRSLNNWQPDADPRVEHESMNPHSCPFVLGYDVGNVPIDRRDPRRNTSMDSHRPRIPVSRVSTAESRLIRPVDSVTPITAGLGESEPLPVRPSHHEPVAAASPSSVPTVVELPKTYPVDPGKVKVILSTRKARALLMIGYPVTDLIQVIEQRLRTSNEDFANLDEFMDAIHANRIATPVNSGVNYDDGPNVESNTTLANRSLGIQLIADATVSSKSKARAVKPSDLSSEDSDSDEEINREQHWKQHINKREISETKKENIANELRDLQEENRQLREARECKVCLEEQIGMVFIPCGHACTCIGCAATVTHCPMCRMFIRETCDSSKLHTSLDHRSKKAKSKRLWNAAQRRIGY